MAGQHAVEILYANCHALVVLSGLGGVCRFRDSLCKLSCTCCLSYKARSVRRILVASNAIKTIDNKMINLIKLHYYIV